MATNLIVIEGNLTADPELRFTPSGHAVASGTVAHTPRVKKGDQWEDGETVFLPYSVWRDHAENVAESLQRGTRVVLVGRLKARSYETRDGDKRTVIEVDVDQITPSLQRASAKVTKADRSSGGGSSQGGWDANAVAQPLDDPWATR